jgi:hypothetical protein
MTNQLAALLVPFAIACAAEAPRKEPTKVFDFSGSELVRLGALPPPKPGASPKTLVRYSVKSAQPELLGCYVAHGHGARGTIALSLRLSGGPDGTLVESVDVGGDVTGDAFVDCVRDTVMSIQFSPLQESGVWQVNFPFTVGA